MAPVTRPDHLNIFNVAEVEKSLNADKTRVDPVRLRTLSVKTPEATSEYVLEVKDLLSTVYFYTPVVHFPELLRPEIDERLRVRIFQVPCDRLGVQSDAVLHWTDSIVPFLGHGTRCFITGGPWSTWHKVKSQNEFNACDLRRTGCRGIHECVERNPRCH